MLNLLPASGDDRMMGLLDEKRGSLMSHPASHYSMLLLLIAVCAVVGCSDRERTPHLVFEQMEEIPDHSLRQEWIQAKGRHSSRGRKAMLVTFRAAKLMDELQLPLK